MPGSENEPDSVTRWKLVLKTSTLPALKLVAYRNVPWSLLPMARPLKTAAEDGSTTVTAVFIGASQATMLPSSVANMNRPCRATPSQSLKVKELVPSNTTPVGVPAPAQSVIGMLTGLKGAANSDPSALRRVLMPVPLSDVHHGVVGPLTSPHGFTRLESMCGARSGRSDARSVSV